MAKIEIAVYNEQCNAPGELCLGADRIYGDRAKETDDLWWFEANDEDAAIEQARDMLAWPNRWANRAARNILRYLGAGA